MGVAGAAWATVIPQEISCVWVVSFLLGTKTFLKIPWDNPRLCRKVILPCLTLRLAPFIMQASESIIAVCFNSSLLRYGGDTAVGTVTILTSVMQFAMLPLQGVGQGAQPFISFNCGARNRGRVREAYFLLLKINTLYSTALWALIQLFPEAFASIFTSDTALVAFTGKAQRIYTAVLFLFGIQVARQMAFTALGRARKSITVGVMRKFVLLISLIYLLPARRTTAVYLAGPAADAAVRTFTAILYAVQFKKSWQG